MIKSVNHTHSVKDSESIVQISAGDVSVYLPVTSGSERRIIINNQGTGTVTVYPKPEDKINGEASMVLVQYDSMEVSDNKTNEWIII